MSTPYILIAVLIGTHQPLTVEYTSQAACENALAVLMPITQTKLLTMSSPPGQTLSRCIPKDAKDKTAKAK